MSADFDRLCAAHLDRSIDAADRARLETLLVTDPECARAFARAALLHDAIARELVAGAIGREAARAAEAAPARGRAWISRRAAIAAVLLLCAGALLWWGVPERRALAAQGELERLLAARAQTRRVYRIEVAEPGDSAAATPRMRPGGRPAKPRPSIDDALLHLGAPGCFVLERHGPGEERTITGSDGATSWSIPERGAVRTSANPARFRGGLPGEQHDLPFVDPVDGIAELQRAYDVSFGPAGAIDGRETRTLLARRRADASRGPRDVAIEYDPASARILRMTLGGLPQANGGPRAVTMRLVEEQPLDAAFFRHESHHEGDRKVIAEE